MNAMARWLFRRVTAWRRTPDPPRPGDDEQWNQPDFPAVRNQHGRNPQARDDEDEIRWTPWAPSRTTATTP